MTRIIIVEDEFRIRQGLANLIQKIHKDYIVVGEAENGYIGFNMIRDLQPDIVITDIQMPKMDGLAMIENVQALGVDCDFVILSGYAQFQYAQQGIRFGVREYLLKPVTITMVRELLERLLAEDVKPEEPLPGHYSKVVQDMCQIIEHQYAQRLGLDLFAQKYKRTPEYLSVLFAKETGITFSNYLKRIRVEHAQKLLLNSNMKIYEVACRVGYPDQKYFSKVFKDYTGVSAKSYVMDNER